DVRELPALLKALESSDIAIGSRLKGTIEKGAMPLAHKLFGTPVINTLLFLLFGARISDSQSGFRAMKKDTFEKLNLRTDGMEFATEMIIKARRMHMRIGEVPIRYGIRTGNSKLRPYRDGAAHVKYMLIQSPLPVYFVSGVVLLGFGLFGLFSVHGPSSFFASATVRLIFPFLGIQTLFLGLFSKTYAHTHLGEENAPIKKFYSAFTIKTAVALSALLIALPIALKFFIPNDLGFDPLLVSIVSGFQIFFNSLFLSTLSIK
ncbi:MAG: hypothetical protein B7Z72_11010, partial [Gemmatimonadetes bacterium 21-71-4]